MWVRDPKDAPVKPLSPPVSPRPSEWKPSGPQRGNGMVMYDKPASILGAQPPYVVAGWAWTLQDAQPAMDVTIALSRVATRQQYLFRAWRMPRPDVAAVFGSDKLLLSGYRAFADVPAGVYDLVIIQEDTEGYTSDPAGQVAFP